MESVHAKSYSSIFFYLNTKSEIERDFRMDQHQSFPSKEGEVINEICLNGTPWKKVASVSLKPSSSTLVSSHLYILSNSGQLVAEIIRVDHSWRISSGTYIGYKFQLGFNRITRRRTRKTQESGCMTCSTHPLWEWRKGYTEASMMVLAGLRSQDSSF